MKYFTALLLNLICLSVWAQEEVILTVDNQPITLAEFEAVYNKNNVQSSSIEEKSLEAYMELFINFKLKVKEAEVMGLDTLNSFKQELAKYVQELKKPYLIDQTQNEAIIKEAYDRMGEDLEASHILIRLTENATPVDTLLAYKRIKEIRELVANGADFNKLAAERSEDPSAKDNGGYLGYFTAFRMVYPFESAAYNTPEGEVSEIVRTSFGYHIIKVTDRREAMGQVRAAHIMVRSISGDSEEEKANAEKKANEIYERLGNGEKFENLARTYSDDKASARRGGELSWFGAGRMVAPFENAVLELKEGEYSKPFRTEYGWHIVKLIERKPIGDFETMKAELKQKVSRDVRGDRSKESLVNKLMKDYSVKVNQKSLSKVNETVTDTVLTGKWSIPENANWKKAVLTLKDSEYLGETTTYSQHDYAEYIVAHQRDYRVNSLDKFLEDIQKAYIQERILGYESSILDKKYPAYRNLVQEYRDGILLFDLMDKKVWSKAVEDTAGLEAFYSNHKDAYMWEDRMDVTIYSCSDESKALKVAEMLNSGQNDSAIIATLNAKSQLAVSVKRGKFEIASLPVLEKVEQKEGISEVIPMNGNFVVVNVKGFLPAQPKTLNEARGLYTADYQNFLEEKWITELRKKYSFKVNQEVMQMVNN